MDRLGRIRLVKAARAEDVENRLITLARSGQLRQKITEDQLKDMLGQLSEQQETGQRARKRPATSKEPEKTPPSVLGSAR